MDSDIVIVGGGPAGLSLATSLSGHGLAITVVERQTLEQLAEPPFDGREIALTHRSIRILDGLSAWTPRMGDEAAPLRAAMVLNGKSQFTLCFEPSSRIEGLLGWLVPNQCIRRELFRTTASRSDIRFLTGIEVTGVRSQHDRVEVVLSNGIVLHSRMLIAADSRFSTIRGMLGIGATMQRTGRSMLVCRVEHEANHARVATEWFDYRQALALLPLHGRTSSAVITLPSAEAEHLAGLSEAAFGEVISRRFAFRLGQMRLVSTRHVYPLTVTWAKRFVAPRAALIGDAAVGMHPVTAHGFNLGLLGQHGLARELLQAHGHSRDPGDAHALQRFERLHRLACRPIFDATNAIVGLYTRDDAIARLARPALLRAAGRLPMIRRGVGTLLARH